MSTIEEPTRPSSPPTVRAVESPADLAVAVDTLSAAFYDDPVLSWLCPDDDRRRATLPGWFGVITRSLHHHHHRAIHLSPDGTGAAVWVPPGVPMVEDDEAFGAAMVAVSPLDAERFGTLIGEAEAVHPEEPHWYLFFIGVTPDRQGQGLGSALLRAVLDRCDRDGTPAYLESTRPENRRLYERHGFVRTGEIVLPGGPRPTTMWREPQPSGDGSPSPPSFTVS